MDTSNWRPNQGGSGSGDSSMESVDWRTQLSADSRQKIANKIMDVLKKHLPFGQEKLHELKNIALRFEEKIYTAATSQADYMRKISIKLMAMENRSANPMPNPLQQNSGGNSVNPSDTGSQSQGMQQVNSQSQPLPIPVPSNHPQPGAQQSQSQILPQNTNNNNIASQSTMPNISAQNSSFQNMPNISGVQQNPVGNNMGQGIPPSANNFISQRQIQGSQQLNPLQQSQNSQQYLYQQQLHQIAKQKLQQQQQQQQNNNNNAATSHIQQQHHNLLPPGHFPPPSLSTLQQNQQPVLQHHQQSVIRQQRQQPNPMGQLSSYSDMQQPRLLRHQNNLSNVQQPHQQQSIGQRNNFSAMHQQQHQLLNNQDSGQLLQSKVSIPQQNQPTQGQRAPELQQQVVMPQLQAQSGQQLQHQLNMKPQPNMSQRDMQQRLPAPGAFQQQNLMSDQQKQLFQQQRAMPEASSTSSDSTAQTGNPNAGDWQEELYQKMKGLKDKYMPELNDVYHKITARLQLPDSHPHQPKGEQVDRIKAYKTALDRVLTFLQIPKSNISPQFKDKLAGCEANIHSLIGTNKRKNGVMMQQTQSNMTHMQPNENQINLQGTMASIRGASNAKANMIGGIQPTSNLDGGPNNTMNSLQQLTGGTQQVNVNPLTSSQGGMSMLQHQQLKQLHQRQMQQQLLHKQQLLQQQQLHRQTKQQVNHLPQQIGIKSESLQQQRPSYHQSLKPGGPFSPQLLPPSSTSSPTIPQHLSPQTDQQSLLNSFTKSGTPLQSANSPFIVSSPSTPSTSHFPGDSEKVNSGVSSLSNAGNVGSQPTQSLAIGTPGISASPLLAEFTSPDGNQGNGAASVSGKSSSAEEPIDHLLKVVKSMSSKSLSASISEIGSVVSMVDSIAGAMPSNGSKGAIGDDLVALTKSRLQGTTFTSQDGTRKMRRFTSSMPFNVVSSASSVNDSFKNFNGVEASELESTATSTVKRPRIEKSNALLEEIKEINQGLIDTVVDISKEDAESGKGTVVKCSFGAISLGTNLKSQYASPQMSPIQPLRLLVPANYPNCSPIFLDKFPVDISNEYEDLSIKAKMRFSSCIRRLSEPMSLEEMASTWDVCAREVISEYAQKNGGGTFTSKYGAWEDCLTAA